MVEAKVEAYIVHMTFVSVREKSLEAFFEALSIQSYKK